MKPTPPVLSPLPHSCRGSLDWEGLPLLSWDLTLPCWEGASPAARRLDRYYRRVEERLVARLKKRFPAACRAAQAALDRSRPIPMEQVTAEYQVTGQREDLLSLLWTLRRAGEVRPFADLWSLPGGFPLRGRDLLPPQAARAAGRAPLLWREEGFFRLWPEGWVQIQPFSEEA